VRRLRDGGIAVELLLAGTPDSGSADSLTEAELRALDAEPGVEWLGHVPDVREVWRRAAIAVLPSSYGEGVPKALLEAAACGRPIIASDAPGCREIVVQKQTGLLIPLGDVRLLAAVIQILVEDRDLRGRMGAAGRERVVGEFSEEIVTAETLSLLQAMLAEEERQG